MDLSQEDLVTPRQPDIGDDLSFSDIIVPDIQHKVISYKPDEPRLIISKIEITYFKSFATMKVLGPFHKNFTAIVGPNGSGKSNVIDALLFVFGFKASKIRLKKISNLIHNCAAFKQAGVALDYCNVTVFFQKILDTGIGDNDYDIVPDSNFTVARTAHSDNSSAYYVNNRKCMFKEVQNLLMSHGIDLEHNRFLILQGEVEHIALMRPKAHNNEDGLLEFLEDIIGSSRFKEPIEKLALRVERLNEIRGEKLNRAKVVENEKKKLEGVKDEAVQYLKAENDVAIERNKLFQINAYKCRVNMTMFMEQSATLEEKSGEVSKRMEEFENSKGEISRRCEQLKKELKRLVNSDEKKREEFNRIDQEFVKTQQDLKHSQSKSKTLAKDIENEKKKLEDLRLKPEKISNENEELAARIAELEANKATLSVELQKVLESLRPLTQDLQKEKDVFEEQLVELSRNSDELKQKLDVSRKELELLLKQQQSGEAKLRQARNDREEAATTLEGREKMMVDLKAKLPKSEQQLERAQKDLQNAGTEERKLVEQIREGRAKVEEMRSSARTKQSQGDVLKSLLEEKRRGRIPGIFGRLGDLGAIDSKYDIAVSTACGNLDFIICDTLDTATQCVKFLKDRNIGRANFLSLDKQQHLWNQIRRKDQAPEGVPRLFDLIRTNDEKFLPAFYYGCRETLVAKDLEQARRIGYGARRYRVVAMDGKLIETSGTMAGGGRPIRGKMGSKIAEEVDPLSVQKEEESIQNYESMLANYRRNKDLYQGTIQKCQRELEQDRHMVERCQQDIQGFKDKGNTLDKRIRDLEAELQRAIPDPAVVGNLEEKIKGEQKDFDKAQAARQKVQSKVDSQDERITAITEGKTKPVQTRVDNTNEELDAAQGKLTKNKAAAKSTERNLKKTADRVESLQQEEEECKESIGNLKARIETLNDEAVKINAEADEVQKEKTETEGTLERKSAELKSVEKNEASIRSEVIEFENEKKELDAKLKDFKAKERHWLGEIEKLQLHDIEGEELPELEKLKDEELAEATDDLIQQFKFQVTVLEAQMAKMNPNMAAIAEYRKKEALYLQRLAELENVTKLRDSQRTAHDDYRKQRHEEFLTGFTVITNKLKEMYRMITLGGDAELECVDSLDPFAEGVVFSVRPPKKSWKQITNLSGGEKTLSSLALVFALHHYKPTPLYVMDEIDAALDFKNVSIVANYIKERTKNAQFIIISLRNNMFELADRLVGIYKTFDNTKTIPVDPSKLYIPSRAESRRIASQRPREEERHQPQPPSTSPPNARMDLENLDESAIPPVEPTDLHLGTTFDSEYEMEIVNRTAVDMDTASSAEDLVDETI